jgi:hypothetical protein
MEDESTSETRQTAGDSVSSEEPASKKRKSVEPEPIEQPKVEEDVRPASPINSPDDSDTQIKPEQATDANTVSSTFLLYYHLYLTRSTQSEEGTVSLEAAETVQSSSSAEVSAAPQFSTTARVFPISTSSSLSDWNGQQLSQPANPVYSTSTNPYPAIVDIPSANASDTARFAEDASMQLDQSFGSYGDSVQQDQWQNNGMQDSVVNQSWMPSNCAVDTGSQTPMATDASSSIGSSQYNMSTDFGEIARADGSGDAANWLQSMRDEDAMMLLEMLNSYDPNQTSGLDVNVNGAQQSSTSQSSQDVNMQVDSLSPDLLGNSQNTMQSYDNGFQSSLNPAQAQYPMQSQSEPGIFINLSQEAMYAAQASIPDAGEGAYAFQGDQPYEFMNTNLQSRTGNPVHHHAPATQTWEESGMHTEGNPSESAPAQEDEVYDFGTSAHPFYVRVMPRAHVPDSPQRKRDRLIWLAWRNRMPTYVYLPCSLTLNILNLTRFLPVVTSIISSMI